MIPAPGDNPAARIRIGISGLDSILSGGYLADAAVLLRHFEAAERMRKALSVIKKRYGGHETSVRELLMSSGGVKVGGLPTQFTGILAGSPGYAGATEDLMDVPLDDERD